MAMPTTAAAIGSILAVTSETTLTTNPMIDSASAADQAQLFPSNRLYATTNDAIHRISIPRGINNTPNTVKIDPLSCASAVCPQCSIAFELYMIEPNTLSTLAAPIIYFLCLIRKKVVFFSLQFILVLPSET